MLCGQAVTGYGAARVAERHPALPAANFVLAYVEGPSGFVSSVCFTGDERRTLVITAAGDSGGALYATEVDVPGLEPPPARV